jgi:hypothetical protein
MRRGLLVGFALWLSACAGTERAAHIVEPTAASRAALRAAVSQALGGADVTLADDALTDSSRLTIEHVVRRDAAGNRIVGRDLTTPVVFELVKHDQQCVLVRAADGAHWVLAATTCEYQ